MDERFPVVTKTSAPPLPPRPVTHPPLRAVDEVEFANTCAQVARAYLMGQGIHAIAKTLGLAPTSVRDVYLQHLRQTWLAEAQQDFSQRQALEVARLDHLETQYYAGWERSTQSKSSQRKYEKFTPKAEKYPAGLETHVEQQVGDPRFLEGVLKCIAQRCKILGIAPEPEGTAGATPEVTHDLHARIRKYEAQFGVRISIEATAASPPVNGHGAAQSVDTERSPSAAERVSDVIDAEWRDGS